MKALQVLSDDQSITSDTDCESESECASISNRSNTYIKQKLKKSIRNHGYVSSSSSGSTSDSSANQPKRSKKISGLVTSSKQKIKYPQDCPQSKLQLEFANKRIRFEDLRFNQFVAGELEIVLTCRNEKEKMGRLALLKKISYYYELYDWGALLQFYAAWIRRIESGQNAWADDSNEIETPLLAGAVKYKSHSYRSRFVSAGSSSRTNNIDPIVSKTPYVWFCSNFQKKRCSFNSAHSKTIKGQVRQVHHICAVCLLKDKNHLAHPESDPVCPHFEL